MPPPDGITKIQSLLQRMGSTDKDFRFMATNDLMSELQRETIRWDNESETKVTQQVINLLRDRNGEVQNQAVKCLGSLVGKIKDDRRQLVITSLCTMLKSDSEQIRDITSIALKTIVLKIPINSRIIEIVNEDLIPNLLIAIANSKDVNVQLESLDIMTVLLTRIGSQLSIHHVSLQQRLIDQLQSERSAVRKRSMNALSNLLACCSDELFNATIDKLLHSLVELVPKSTTEAEELFTPDSAVCTSSKTLLQCIATAVRAAGHRSNHEQLTQIMPVLHTFCLINDDELREYCLQTFEVYVRRCSVDIGSSLPGIIEVCSKNLSHDPNYKYDGYHMNEEVMETDIIGDDSDSLSIEDSDLWFGRRDSDPPEDYSDDDDLSWKVRRASAKCLEAIIWARRDLTTEFLSTIAPILLSRFKEREESVKSDIIQTFVALLKQTRHLVNDCKCHHEGSIASSKLAEMIPDIAAKSSHLLQEKGVKTRQVVLQIYREIMNTIPNALSDHIVSLIPGILYSLTDKNSTSNMKIDALIFLQELIKTHQSRIFHPHIDVILSAVISALSDSFYKISSEALTLLSCLICVMRPANEPMPNYQSTLFIIYQKTLEWMFKTDIDLEIKEKAITCMGQIIATFGDRMEQQLPIALNTILEKLNNETTRLTTVKALIKIANSPLQMSLNCIFPQAFTSLANFLRKNSRPLRISTLILIDSVVKRSEDLLDVESAQSVILVDIPSLINESDLYVSQLALTMLTTIIKTRKAFNSIVPQQVLPEALKLVRSPLLQGSALQAMLQFFTTIVECSFPLLDHATLLAKLVEPIFSSLLVHKQAFNSTAKAIAAISVGDEERAVSTVTQLISDYKLSNDGVYALTLLSIGEIGKVTNLSKVPHLVDFLLAAFNSSSEDVKSAGSYALGCVAVGCLDKYLPIILHEIEARNKRQYLILHSLREVISAGHLEQLEAIWSLLMKHCECQEEGTRNVVSECLGKLTLLKPFVLLQRLINHLKNDYANKPLARSTIVAAIKFTISDQPQEIDNLLRQCIGEFLRALQDDDINVRRVALITFNSAAHNKPTLILDLLPQIMPLLYKETLVKPELIREVEMGPFKHQVDDGLDSRKAAYECMYTLLDTCQSHLDIFEFLTHVENGLKDHYDIKMLTYLMLNRLATLCPSAVLQRMERLVYPIEEVCSTRPKENAVKQEYEKQDELKRSALRAIDALKSIPNADRHPVLARFFENLVKGNKELSELYSSIHRDSISNSDNVQKMDLS